MPDLRGFKNLAGLNPVNNEKLPFLQITGLIAENMQAAQKATQLLENLTATSRQLP
jgi:hypothetical protein